MGRKVQGLLVPLEAILAQVVPQGLQALRRARAQAAVFLADVWAGVLVRPRPRVRKPDRPRARHRGPLLGRFRAAQHRFGASLPANRCKGLVTLAQGPGGTMERLRKPA